MPRSWVTSQPSGSPRLPHFEERLPALIALAEGHADAHDIIAAPQDCMPTYEPFDWTLVGSFPGSAQSNEPTVTVAEAPAPSATSSADPGRVSRGQTVNA